MTNKSKRTHPLDRDGDGAAGGSLPGNQTAPMATEAPATETAEPSWIRDNAAILLKLAEAGIEIDTTKPAALAEETLADWTNDDAHAAEIFADQMTADGSHMDEEGGDWLTADLNPIAIPAVLEPYLFRNVEQGDTFDAEHVEAARKAGEGAVIAEEGETVADPATATAPLDDGLVTIETETAPVAVRMHELRTLVTARRLYKSPEGYSSNYGAPYIDQATIDAWIAAGLAEDVPTAGNQGGVRVTAEARSVLNRAPTPEVA